MCAAALPRPDAFSEALKTHTEGKCRFLEFICILLEIYAQHLRIYHALIYIEQSTSQFLSAWNKYFAHDFKDGNN